MPPLRARLRVLAIFPEAVDPGLFEAWRAWLEANEGSSVVREDGPDERFVSGLVRVGQRATE